ncbi:hypothetical protein Nepgr_025278 [Nepenthes gracilis]|uniref:Transmembrane protein n=1 Tax=Nepenthes gracilis TaxID=150966 RepID=A0AAD3T4W6_NEPGR|nr:hypothetical protein Nepgr_025278 [Nepenthes gracilis]
MDTFSIVIMKRYVAVAMVEVLVVIVKALWQSGGGSITVVAMWWGGGQCDGCMGGVVMAIVESGRQAAGESYYNGWCRCVGDDSGLSMVVVVVVVVAVYWWLNIVVVFIVGWRCWELT